MFVNESFKKIVSNNFNFNFKNVVKFNLIISPKFYLYGIRTTLFCLVKKKTSSRI